MGKHDFASPKAIGNRIKAKGLQKLKFYCQLCNKQCRDENGFKCHLTSEAHLRQMEVFGQNPRRVIEDYSSQFLKSFLEHLKRTHPFSRVEANHVYNDFISDKEHVHMNATKWLSLTDFVKWLGREGLCKVDETEKGWFIKLVREEDPTEKKRREREKAEKESDERHLKALQAQAARAKKARTTSGDDDNDGGVGSVVELDRVKDVIVKVNEDRRVVKERVIESKEVFTAGDAAGPSSTANARTARPKSNIELLMERELAKKKAAHAQQSQQGAGKPDGRMTRAGSDSRRRHGCAKTSSSRCSVLVSRITDTTRRKESSSTWWMVVSWRRLKCLAAAMWCGLIRRSWRRSCRALESPSWWSRDRCAAKRVRCRRSTRPGTVHSSAASGEMGTRRTSFSSMNFSAN